MRIKTARMKLLKIPKKKKVDSSKEIVKECDFCHCELPVSRCRTAGSAVCAQMSGNYSCQRDSKWLFFCNKECAEKYEHRTNLTVGNSCACSSIS